MGRRRSLAPLLLIFGVLAVVLAALAPVAESSSSHHHHHGHGHHSRVQSRGHGGEGEQSSSAAAAAKARGSAWPCCDSCGGCTKSDTPQCRCMDAAPGGCHPACRDCVRSALAVHPAVYQCMDRVPNFCQRRCSAIAAH
ncbi:hypothetical protein CFC21_074551 [Triticum aestivum]|uniref:Bowman-Birk serine protease inhibitors family domain-containing protein n=2 Tax=Triticum aestivum TaxID=4565 RepID=A0A9R1KWE2_WHEAT|nr:Bowman-Birk type proteinase inhibitor PVI-3(2)-like [Triticum dicoccoides]XP_044394191.1 Bowman-Birk type proteinase inhibitor PVI-3(2)-like [Triticum aestivum]KAF7030700.1 hypothetical protein CFC21_042178 [Triticum aestivum]KAF7068831.1 hypothetical protein CFC21_074551 [Triticum aestivum]